MRNSLNYTLSNCCRHQTCPSLRSLRRRTMRIPAEARQCHTTGTRPASHFARRPGVFQHACRTFRIHIHTKAQRHLQGSSTTGHNLKPGTSVVWTRRFRLPLRFRANCITPGAEHLNASLSMGAHDELTVPAMTQAVLRRMPQRLLPGRQIPCGRWSSVSLKCGPAPRQWILQGTGAFRGHRVRVRVPVPQS